MTSSPSKRRMSRASYSERADRRFRGCDEAPLVHQGHRVGDVGTELAVGVEERHALPDRVVHSPGRRAGFQWRAQIERLRRAERLERDHGLDVRDDFPRVAGRRHAHAHVVLLPRRSTGSSRPRRDARATCTRSQRGRRVLHEHESRVQPGAVHEERRQAVVRDVVEQAVEAPLARSSRARPTPARPRRVRPRRAARGSCRRRRPHHLGSTMGLSLTLFASMRSTSLA